MSNVVDLPLNVETQKWGKTTNGFPQYQPNSAPTRPIQSAPVHPVVQAVAPQISIQHMQGGENNQAPKVYTTRIVSNISTKLGQTNAKTLTEKIDASHAQSIWRPDSKNKTHDITPLEDDISPDNLDLSKVIITKITLESSINEFPFPVTVDCTAQRDSASCNSMNGNQFAHMLYPNEKHRGQVEIYDAQDAITDPFLKKYGHCDLNDLWGNIQTFKDQGYVYVPTDHVVVKLAAMNSDIYGAPPTSADIREEKFYKMDGQVVGTIIDQLYLNVISKFKFTDLNKFQVAYQRYDGKTFSDPSNTTLESMAPEDRLLLEDKVFHVGCTLKINWIIPQNVKSNTRITALRTSNVVNPNIAQNYSVLNSSTYQQYTTNKNYKTPF